ncbi:MAG: phosphoadenylyl-sulfate reductase [Pseudomonadota bacterium]
MKLAALNEYDSREAAAASADAMMARLDASDRVRWALDHLPKTLVVSSSFGAQAAAMLHLVTREAPDTPVVLIDTGYLFPETYRFVDELTERLALNLKVYRSEQSPAWQEARYGKRWEQGREGIDAYNQDNKVRPMERALDDLGAGTWLAGLRRTQSSTRQNLPFVQTSGERWKVHPILDWSDRDLHRYLKKHDLPYHPLWADGYVSIGDVHTTRSLREVSSIEDTRFHGLTRECGLHEMDFGQ